MRDSLHRARAGSGATEKLDAVRVRVRGGIGRGGCRRSGASCRYGGGADKRSRTTRAASARLCGGAGATIFGNAIDAAPPVDLVKTLREVFAIGSVIEPSLTMSQIPAALRYWGLW